MGEASVRKLWIGDWVVQWWSGWASGHDGKFDPVPHQLLTVNWLKIKSDVFCNHPHIWETIITQTNLPQNCSHALSGGAHAFLYSK